MIILQLVHAPDRATMVYDDNRRTVPVVCLALCKLDSDDADSFILPCMIMNGQIRPYAGEDARMVL